MLHWEMGCGSAIAVKLMGLPLVFPSAYFDTKPQDTWSGDGFGVASLPPPPHPAIKQVIPSMATVQRGDLIQGSVSCCLVTGFK